MKQWMRRFFAVLMMVCLLAGNAWAEETALVDVNELLDGVITAELSGNALNFDAAYTLNALNDASQNAASADEYGEEGGIMVVCTAEGKLLSMAVRYFDKIVAVSNSGIKTATSLKIIDLTTGESYPAQIDGEKNSLIFFKLDEMPDVEKLYMTNGIPAGATVGTNGGIYSYYVDGDSIRITKVQVTRPAEGELFGTYSGAELMQGSPIFFFTDDKERVIIGLADKNHRDLDLYAYYELTTAANNPTAAPTAVPTSAPTTAPTAVPAGASTDAPNNPPTDAPTAVPTEVPTNAPTAAPTEVPTDAPTAAPTAAPTESPAAESPTQTVLYVIIGVLAAAVVALVLTRGRKKGGKNQQEEAETQRFQQPEEKDAPTQQLPVEEKPQPRVALECIGGALQGMTFPISSRVVFGRDPKRCSIIYPKDAKGISSVHCAAEPTADGLIILTDLGSTYGTMVGGQQLTAGKGVTLHPGDAFTLGGSENRFTVRRL